MDHSSLGRGNDYHDFQSTSQQLQKALKAIVNGIWDLPCQREVLAHESRASSGLQQFHRDFSQDSIMYPGLPGPGAGTERFGPRSENKSYGYEAGIERNGHILSEIR